MSVDSTSNSMGGGQYKKTATLQQLKQIYSELPITSKPPTQDSQRLYRSWIGAFLIKLSLQQLKQIYSKLPKQKPPITQENKNDEEFYRKEIETWIGIPPGPPYGKYRGGDQSSVDQSGQISQSGQSRQSQKSSISQISGCQLEFGHAFTAVFHGSFRNLERLNFKERSEITIIQIGRVGEYTLQSAIIPLMNFYINQLGYPFLNCLCDYIKMHGDRKVYLNKKKPIEKAISDVLSLLPRQERHKFLVYGEKDTIHNLSLGINIPFETFVGQIDNIGILSNSEFITDQPTTDLVLDESTPNILKFKQPFGIYQYKDDAAKLQIIDRITDITDCRDLRAVCEFIRQQQPEGPIILFLTSCRGYLGPVTAQQRQRDLTTRMGLLNVGGGGGGGASAAASIHMPVNIPIITYPVSKQQQDLTVWDFKRISIFSADKHKDIRVIEINVDNLHCTNVL
jgi:hypothetical protein